MNVLVPCEHGVALGLGGRQAVGMVCGRRHSRAAVYEPGARTVTHAAGANEKESTLDM